MPIPHPGNLLIDASGRLVLLDFGMVVRVEQELRTRLIQTVLAVARQDVDGVINGFYALGILDPDVDRGTVQDAARSLMTAVQRDDATPRHIQQVVEEVLQTFYDWPLMLPSDLVYFGRAAVLVEGIGAPLRPQLQRGGRGQAGGRRSSPRGCSGGAAGEARARLADWGTGSSPPRMRTLRELLRRVEREEFRVRWHPRDTLELQRFLAQQVRRALLAFFAFTFGLVSVVIWAVSRRLEVLLVGLTVSFGMFLVIFLLPSHLFQNPLRYPPFMAGALMRRNVVLVPKLFTTMKGYTRQQFGADVNAGVIVGHRGAAAGDRVRHRQRRARRSAACTPRSSPDS